MSSSSSTKPNFSSVWTLQSHSYCPLLDLLQHTSLTHPGLFRDLVWSLARPLLYGKCGADTKHFYNKEDSQVWKSNKKRSSTSLEDDPVASVSSQSWDVRPTITLSDNEKREPCSLPDDQTIEKAANAPLDNSDWNGNEENPCETRPPKRRRSSILKPGARPRSSTSHPCLACPRTFTASHWLHKHCLADHPDQPDVRPEKPVRVKGLRLAHLHERQELRCGLPDCAFHFAHFKGLVRHERTHTEAFICILCGKPTWSSGALIEHCDGEHAEKSRFICRVCGFYSYTEVMLKLHTVQVHMKGTKDYQCQECDYKTCYQSTFAAHVRTHKKLSFVCEECGKECSTQASLTTHKKVHLSSAAHPYHCSHCPKRFPHASLLTLHTRVHTGEKPFQCIDCGQCFGSQSSLIKHNRNLHTPEEMMPYKCQQCGKTFSKARRKVYFCHLKQHQGVRDHICPICNSSFSSRGYLGNHFRKVHKKLLYEFEQELQLKLEHQQEGQVKI